MEKREHARRVGLEAFEGGTSFTILRRASRLTIESEESIEHFGPKRPPGAARALLISDNDSRLWDKT